MYRSSQGLFGISPPSSSDFMFSLVFFFFFFFFLEYTDIRFQNTGYYVFGISFLYSYALHLPPPPPPPPFSFPCLSIAVRLNSKLAEELGSAKKEIEVLKGRLKELEVKEHDRPVSIESKQNTFAQTKAL